MSAVRLRARRETAVSSAGAMRPLIREQVPEAATQVRILPTREITPIAFPLTVLPSRWISRILRLASATVTLRSARRATLGRRLRQLLFVALRREEAPIFYSTAACRAMSMMMYCICLVGDRR